jgi:hypothetical protein
MFTFESGLTVADFAVGDWVLYNPNIPDLPSASERLRDIGVVQSVDEHYVHILFAHNLQHTNEEDEHSILPCALTKVERATYEPLVSNSGKIEEPKAAEDDERQS